MTLRVRELAPEKRAEIMAIRAAARRGLAATAIAEFYQLPLVDVTRTLAPATHGRVTDPAILLNTQAVPPGHAHADVQLYWVGFLTAAGRISGQGSSMALVVTLGDRAESHVTRLMEDMAESRLRPEYCESSLLGWQVYVREPTLCKALLPWGVPSIAYGDDPALLDDLPNQFAAPFLCGYLDGNWPGATFSRKGRLVLNGTVGVLSAVSHTLRTCWGISEGRITASAARARLDYPSLQIDQQVRDRARTYTLRRRYPLVS